MLTRMHATHNTHTHTYTPTNLRERVAVELQAAEASQTAEGRERLDAGEEVLAEVRAQQRLAALQPGEPRKSGVNIELELELELVLELELELELVLELKSELQ